MKYIKYLPHQVILAVFHSIDNGCFDEDAWESFMNDEIENVKKVIIQNNNGIDEFIVFNGTDGFYASQESFTLSEAIKFVTDFHKRYEAQGYYSSNNGRISANEVALEIHYMHYSEEVTEEFTEDYPHYIS